MKKILIVAAHPDDEVLGCGATVAKLIKEGYQATTLILGEGVTSRSDSSKQDTFKEEIKELKEQAIKANEILGIKEIIFNDLPDNSFDSVSLLKIVKKIEQVKNKIDPTIIFTHYKADLNIDHQLTYNAVLVATRPLINETCKEIYSFYVSSSTEWNYPFSFSPDVFFDIKETINLKLKALKAYKSEIREFPHPRSLKGIKINSNYWGISVGLEYVEPFKTVRVIR